MEKGLSYFSRLATLNRRISLLNHFHISKMRRHPWITSLIVPEVSNDILESPGNNPLQRLLKTIARIQPISPAGRPHSTNLFL